MIAIGYDRVSTKRQADKGVMLEARSKSIPAYCAMKGWKLKRYLVDPGLSGREGKKRPNFEKAMDMASKPGHVLVVDSFTRFVRSTIDADRALKRLHDAGGAVVVAQMNIDTTTAMGIFVYKLVANLAELESNQISERIKAANRFTVEKLGYRTQGRQPIGWKIVNGRRVPCERERALVARVMALAETEGLSGAARTLQASGEPTISNLRGSKEPIRWTARKVQNLVAKAPAGSAPHGLDAASEV